MPKVDSRRRITLPAEICKAANIGVGDELKCFTQRDGVISLIKQKAGAAKGCLGDVSANNSFSEQEPLGRSIDE